MSFKKHNATVFEISIENKVKFNEYYLKNLQFFCGNIIALKKKDVNDSIIKILEDNNQYYFINKDSSFNLKKKESLKHSVRDKKETERSVECVITKKDDAKTSYDRCGGNVFYKPIRSGEEVACSDVSIFLGRVNSGALIRSSYPLHFFSTIDGNIVCDAKYMVVSGIGSGLVIFNKEELNRDSFDDGLKLVVMEDDSIKIKDIK